MGKEPWYKNGIRFECTGCGDCCKCKPGEEGYVYLSGDDVCAISKCLGIAENIFLEKYTERRLQSLVLKDWNRDCLFLKENKCEIYEARPSQCRTWPFWEIALVPKNWRSKVEGVCPGVGRGKIFSKEEIDHISQNLSNL